MKRFLAAALLAGCAHAGGFERELLQADEDFAGDVAARGVDAWVAAFAPEGAMLPDGDAIVRGEKAMREAMASLGKGLALRWKPLEAHASADGTLGYTIGNFVADGARGTLRGKYLTVWRRGADGRWRVVADIGNPGEAEPGAGP